MFSANRGGPNQDAPRVRVRRVLVATWLAPVIAGFLIAAGIHSSSGEGTVSLILPALIVALFGLGCRRYVYFEGTKPLGAALRSRISIPLTMKMSLRSGLDVLFMVAYAIAFVWLLQVLTGG